MLLETKSPKIASWSAWPDDTPFHSSFSSLFPNFLARTTFVLVSLWEIKIPGQDTIFGDFVLNSCNRKEEERRSIYSISILLLEFIFPFVRPSEYIIIPEVCAQGWYSGSTPVLIVEFGSFFLTFSTYFPHIYALFWQIHEFLGHPLQSYGKIYFNIFRYILRKVGLLWFATSYI